MSSDDDARPDDAAAPAAAETDDGGSGEAGHEHGHEHEHAHQEMDLSRYEGIEGHEIRELSGAERELLAVVPRERFERLVDRQAAQTARRVSIKGFRKGKAPKGRVLALYGDEIRREALESLVNDVWEEVRSSSAVQPISAPVLTEVSLRDGEPVRFAARFEVLENVELKGLDEIRPADKTVKVTDEDVERELEGLRSLRAELVTTDRTEAQPGDHAVVDLERWPPGASRLEAEPEEKREDVVVEVGAEGNLAELDRALLGMAVGETRQFETSYPENHEDESLRGVSVAMSVTLKEIRENVIPELTDELAKELGGWESVEKMREDVRERLLESRRDAARREQDEEIVRALLERHAFDVPRSLVEKEAEVRLRAGLQDLARRGIDPSDTRIDWKGELQRIQEAAARDLKVDYLLDLIAREREVEVDEAAVTEEIEAIAKRRGNEPREVRQHVEKTNQMSNLRSAIRRRRTLDSLRSGATISVE